MSEHPNSRIFRHIADHGPIAAATIAAGLGLDVAVVERAITTLVAVDLIGVAGHAPDGAALYTALQA